MNSALLLHDYDCANSLPTVSTKPAEACSVALTSHEDLSDIQNYFSYLSQESRQMRLHILTREIPQSVLRLYEGLNPKIITGYIARNLSDIVVGEAILATCSSGISAQIGISVCDTKRSCGIGTKLMNELIHRARINGYEFLYADTLRENKSFIAFAQTLGFQRTRHPDDWCQTRLTLNVAQFNN